MNVGDLCISLKDDIPHGTRKGTLLKIINDATPRDSTQKVWFVTPTKARNYNQSGWVSAKYLRPLTAGEKATLLISGSLDLL